MLLLRAILRQFKARCLLVLSLIKRLLCFARRRVKDEEECGVISNGDFVVVESQYSSNKAQEVYKFSNYSFASNINHQRYGSSSLQLNTETNLTKPTTETEQEPDYFQDMVPQLKKPKMIYVGKSGQEDSGSGGTAVDMSRKFRVDERAAVELDESKFQPFGTFDLPVTETLHDQQQQQQQQLLQQYQDNTGWEAMADDDQGSWHVQMEQTLQEHRRAERERRLREHQRQREAKQLARQTQQQQQRIQTNSEPEQYTTISPNVTEPMFITSTNQRSKRSTLTGPRHFMICRIC